MSNRLALALAFAFALGPALAIGLAGCDGAPPPAAVSCDDPQLAARLAAEAVDPSSAAAADPAPRFLTPAQFACVLDDPLAAGYFARLTAFEARMGSGGAVDPGDRPGEAYRAWLATQALPFTDEERTRLTEAARIAGEHLERLYPDLGPPVWNFAKVGSAVQASLPHTHQAAIVWPQAALDRLFADADPALEGAAPAPVQVLLHEAFHVLARMRADRALDPVVGGQMGARGMAAGSFDKGRGPRHVSNPDGTGIWALPFGCRGEGDRLVPLLVVSEIDPSRASVRRAQPAALCVPESALDTGIVVGPETELTLGAQAVGALAQDEPFGVAIVRGSVDEGLASLFVRSILVHAYGDSAVGGFDPEPDRALLEAWGYAGIAPHPVPGD